VLATLAAAALLLVACGDDGGGLSVGDAAPDFSLTDSTGGSVALDDFRGRDVLLYFHMADG
jgi:hypothetical protein